MIKRYKTYWKTKALTGVVSLFAFFTSCTDDIVSDNAGGEASAPFGYINVGASIGDPSMTTRAQVQVPEKEGHYYAETVDWLKGALMRGVDITYSNINSNGEHNFAKERVGILKWNNDKGPTFIDASGNITRAEYTFHYKNGTTETNIQAEWNDNGQHYFEGQYVPAEIRSNSDAPIIATNLTSDQSSDKDHTYTDGSESGEIGNYSLLSHYIGMPPSFKERATVDQIMLPFKHRLARVIAYVLIDDMLEAKLQGYDVPENPRYDSDGFVVNTDKDNPSTTKLSFSYVKVLDHVKEETETVGTEGQSAQVSKLTPAWTSARTVIPHFYNEIRSSAKADGSVAASDDDAKKFFIVYINTKSDKKVHPREDGWLKVHQDFRKAVNLENSTAAMTSTEEAQAEAKTGYRRQMYHRVPIYDVIVRPTYNTTYDNVMYDEEGYYTYTGTGTASHKSEVNETKRKQIFDLNNSISFELELSTGLKYSKTFTFDLNANQQTVVYLRIDREGISYDESSYELWHEDKSTDGYYGVDNEVGHNLSIVGSSWQRALRNGNDPKWDVTDGSNYGDTDNNVGTNNVDDGQYVSNTKWTMEFAKAGVGGSRQGDYFMLDDDITIDMRLLPENFFFAGHLDGKGHKITLTNCGAEATQYVEATESAYLYEDNTQYYKQLYKQTSSGYVPFTAPTLYRFVPNATIEDMENGGIDDSKNGSLEDLEEGDLNNSSNGSIENLEEGSLNNSFNGSIEDMINGTFSSTGRTRADGDGGGDPAPMFVELTDVEKAALTLSNLKRTNTTIYYIQNVDENGVVTSYSRYYLTDKEIAKFYILKGTYTSASTLFAGLNGTYSGEAGKYNLHEEKGVLVPVSGYRGEMVNVTLTNNTFFPTDAVFSGSNLNRSDATVTGYIFNCWEKVDENNWKKIENIVPIPYMQ